MTGICAWSESHRVKPEADHHLSSPDFFETSWANEKRTKSCKCTLVWRSLLLLRLRGRDSQSGRSRTASTQALFVKFYYGNIVIILIQAWWRITYSRTALAESVVLNFAKALTYSSVLLYTLHDEYIRGRTQYNLKGKQTQYQVRPYPCSPTDIWPRKSGGNQHCWTLYNDGEIGKSGANKKVKFFLTWTKP